MGGGMGEADSSSTQSRALTPVVGLVVLIGLVTVASLGILLVAGSQSEEVQQRAEVDRVEGAFLELSQEVRTATTARDVSRSATLDVDGADGAIEYVDRGSIEVDVEGEPAETRELGALEYRARDGTRLVYQAGGVWRVTDGEAHAVSEPAIHSSDGTVTVPVEALKSRAGVDGAGDGAFELRTERSESLYSSMTGENVSITVESEFYEWWGAYFAEIETETDSVTSSLDPENETATIRFEKSESALAYDDATFDETAVETEGSVVTAEEATDAIVGDVGTKADADVRMKVEGNVTARGDVHFSHEGEATGLVAADGSVTGSHHGVGAVVAGDESVVRGPVDRDVHVDGDVDIRSEVGGNVTATGDVELRGDVNGDVRAGGNIEYYYGEQSGSLTGEKITDEYDSGVCDDVTCHEGEADLSDRLDPGALTDDMPSREPVDDFHQRGLDQADATHIGTLTPDDGPLTAGTYVVDEVDVSGSDPLVFDVGAGDVNVFVRESVEMGPDGDVRVLDADSGNATRLFADDTVSIDGSNSVCSAPAATTDCEDIPDSLREANGFQLYGTADSSFSFGGELDYHGVLYAPGWGVDVESTGSVDAYGPVIAGSVDAEGEGAFEHANGTSFVTPALEGDSSGDEQPTYLHVTAHDVALKGE